METSVALIILLYGWLFLCIVFTALVLWALFQLWWSVATTLRNVSVSFRCVSGLWKESIERLTRALACMATEYEKRATAMMNKQERPRTGTAETMATNSYYYTAGGPRFYYEQMATTTRKQTRE